ncbi:MAG: Spo0E like sporulation regulatory protein [Firmicutes bacterium]|nr:Spo0E like sporulation regulatory protein [Bacillota bacterium]
MKIFLLSKKIEIIRERLNMLVQYRSLNDPEVVEISNKIDSLVVQLYQLSHPDLFHCKTFNDNTQYHVSINHLLAASTATHVANNFESIL